MLFFLERQRQVMHCYQVHRFIFLFFCLSLALLVKTLLSFAISFNANPSSNASAKPLIAATDLNLDWNNQIWFHPKQELWPSYCSTNDYCSSFLFFFCSLLQNQSPTLKLSFRSFQTYNDSPCPFSQSIVRSIYPSELDLIFSSTNACSKFFLWSFVCCQQHQTGFL